MKNWKTTANGVIAALVAVLSSVSAIIDNDAATSPDWAAAGAAIYAAFILFRAEDRKDESNS
jgi:hypothetical protein